MYSPAFDIVLSHLVKKLLFDKKITVNQKLNKRRIGILSQIM